MMTTTYERLTTLHLDGMTINELLHYKKRLLELLEQIDITLIYKEVTKGDKT